MRIPVAVTIGVLAAGLWTGAAAGQGRGQGAGRGAAPAAPQPTPNAPLYRHTGEQYRIYNFPGTGESIPYRLFVPTTWTPEKRLPMLVTLRAGNTVDGPYRAGNDLVKQAAQRGYIVVTPMGYRGLASRTTAAATRSLAPTRPRPRLDGRRSRTSVPSRTCST